MSVLWPEELPCPVWAGYGVAPADTRISKSVEAGPGGSRRRTSRVPKLVNATVHLDADQFCAFENFYEETLKAGSLLFWMPDKMRDGQPILLSGGAPLLDSSGNPILMTAMDLCKFGKDGYSATGSPRYRMVTMSIEKLPV